MNKADKQALKDLFDTAPNMTVARIAEHFGITVAEAKRILMEQDT